MAQAATARARRPAARQSRAARGRSPIRWDRLARTALLVVLLAILGLYISPVRSWLTQSRTAEDHRTEVRQLERENAELRARARALKRPEVLEREARRLGMVRRGERAYVIENLPGR
jgi:cell division protein FtsB